MKISEIFFSYQAEGLYIGSPTIFIRFSGCNLNCYYCDEKKAKKVMNAKTKNIDEIISFLKDFIVKNKVKFISLTGGEPLIQKDLKDLVNGLSILKKERKIKIYLETNGSLPSILKNVIKYIDVISLDLKIPFNDINKKNILKEFKESLNICKKNKKIYFVKLIIGGKILYSKNFIYLLKKIVKNLKLKELIIQPVTEELIKNNKNLFFNISNIFSALKEEINNIYIIPQLHKTIWQIK